MADKPESTARMVDGLPTDRLKRELEGLLAALRERAVASITEGITGATSRLTDYAENGGGPGLVAALTGAKNLSEGKSPAKAAMSGGFAGMKEKVKQVAGGGKRSQGKNNLKVTNIVEHIDVGVPARDAYNLWTQFTDFPSFMKKVESVEQEEDETLNWKAQVLWSHRTWKATIIEQVPDERIVWRSEGSKGHVDGAVSFHEIAPRLTRILVVLEYYPQGFFEYTGNLWRAQGRRARLEIKHFRRHVMTNAILNPEEIEGWRGEIRDGEVVKDHETALKEEQEDRDEREDRDEDEPRDEQEDRDEDEPRDEEEDQDEEEPRDEQEDRDDRQDRRRARTPSARRRSEDEERAPDREKVSASRGRSRRQ